LFCFHWQLTTENWELLCKWVAFPVCVSTISRQEDKCMIEAGIVGGSGYSGGELLRILLQHPSVRVKWVTSRGDKKLELIHRNFYGMGLEFITLEEARGGDVVFLCTP
jgi:hypothetical protein